VPAHALAQRDQLRLLVEHAHEDLLRREELHVGLAPLVGGHRVHDVLLRPDVPGRREALEDRLARLVDEEALLGPGERRHVAVATHGLAQREPVLLEPLHVRLVAERAAHHDPGALLGIHLLVGEDRDVAAALEGDERAAAEQLARARVARVEEHRAARGEQLGAGGRDLDRPAAYEVEAQRRELRGLVHELEVGLRERRAALGAPEGRRLLQVGLALAPEVEEAPLADPHAAVVDRAVGERPVGRQADRPHHRLELALVLRRRLEAQPHEVGAGHVLALDPVLLLREPLRRQPVPVEAERVEHVEAPHALVPRDALGLRVREEVADVEGARDGGGRRVDREDRRTVRGVGIEGVAALPLPEGLGGGIDRLGVVGGVEGRGGRRSHGATRVRGGPGGW
jgi:hypothetical protein